MARATRWRSAAAESNDDDSCGLYDQLGMTKSTVGGKSAPRSIRLEPAVGARPRYHIAIAGFCHTRRHFARPRTCQRGHTNSAASCGLRKACLVFGRRGAAIGAPTTSSHALTSSRRPLAFRRSPQEIGLSLAPYMLDRAVTKIGYSSLDSDAQMACIRELQRGSVRPDDRLAPIVRTVPA